jgi:hypothetical protein
MTNEQTGSSMVMTAVLAAVPAIVAFGVMRVMGGFDNWTAVLLAVLIWIALAVFLVSALHRADRSSVRLDAMPAPAPVAAPVPAQAPKPVIVAPVAAPAPAAAIMSAPAAPGKPAGLSAARGGKPDDLKEIVGVGRLGGREP